MHFAKPSLNLASGTVSVVNIASGTVSVVVSVEGDDEVMLNVLRCQLTY